jgi:AraC-like DNA-binding protein
MTWAVVGLALASVLALLGRRRASDAELLFAVFCGSVAMAMLRPGLGDVPVAVTLLVTVGAAFTCNAYWLVARALFRGDGAVGRVHLGVAGGIAVLVVAYRGVDALGAAPWAEAIGALLTLASSTVMVLGLVEALRGFGPALSVAERRLRLGFMAVCGAGMLVATVGQSMPATVLDASAKRVMVLLAASAVVVFTHFALRQRRQAPMAAVVPLVAIETAADDPAEAAAAPKPAPSDEDRALGEAILRVLETRALYRDPELKVADLAAAVGSVEHKVSRAITQALGERNFNQLVNRHRIAHACRMLAAGEGRSVLEVSLESGFGSLGPFNRAFKAATGQTPTEWRDRRRAPA